MPTRRTFTITALAASFAALASAGGAALAFALGPLAKRKGAAGPPLDLGAASDFDAVRSGAAGAAEVVVERRVDDLYTTRRVKERLAVVRDPAAPSGLAALDTTCTHLGCGVSWSAERKVFLCPCHGGVYAADGRVLAGPPPRPLARRPLLVSDGRVTLDPKAFES